MVVLAWVLLGWVGFDAAVFLLLWRRSQVRDAHQYAAWLRRRHWQRWASHRTRWVAAPMR
jgi:hypothetical protein